MIEDKRCTGGGPAQACRPGAASMGDTCSATSCSADGGPGRVCPDALRRVRELLTQPPRKAVIACEGACIKGEVARIAANILAYERQRDATVRICLGDASTGDSGMATLVRRAPEVIALEGCPLHCGTTIMKRNLPDLQPTIIDTSRLYSFDRSRYFEICDLPREKLEEFARTVADQVNAVCFAERPAGS